MCDNKKNNTFEHIIYEFQMYFQTCYLINNYYLRSKNNLVYLCFDKKINHHIAKNLILESHQHHTRNLIGFFSNTSRNDNDIIISRIIKKDVLKNNSFVCYEKIKDNNSKYVYNNKNIQSIMNIFNTGVSHLSSYRTKEGLSKETIEAIADMYNGNDRKKIVRIPSKIFDFLILLEPDNLEPQLEIKIDNICEYHDLKQELAEQGIQDMIIDLKKYL